MPHPSEALLVAFADHELGPAEHSQVTEHVRGCGVCRHALRDVREAMAAVHVESALIDAAEPVTWREQVRPPVRPARHSAPRPRAIAGADASSLTRSTAGGRRRAGVLGPLRWAAVLMVFVAGGATAMLAPRWRALVTDAPVDAPPSAASTPAAVATAAPELRTAAAVSVLPRDGRATVVLQRSATPAGEGAASPALLVVTVGERADVQVTVTSPRASLETPRFRTADGRLDVALVGTESRVEVEVPASLAEAHIVLGTRTVASVRAGVVAPLRASTSGVPLGQER